MTKEEAMAFMYQDASALLDRDIYEKHDIFVDPSGNEYLQMVVCEYNPVGESRYVCLTVPLDVRTPNLSKYSMIVQRCKGQLQKAITDNNNLHNLTLLKGE